MSAICIHPGPPPAVDLLRVDALRVRIDLEPLLRHLGVSEEVERHPDQMPLDLIQFLPYFSHRHVGVVEMSLLEFVMSWEEAGVVFKGFDWKPR